MRLHAYEDRFGDRRFGVVVDGRLLTGAQLEKRGGLDRLALDGVDTHLGMAFHLATSGDWLAQVRRATRRALKAGAPLVKLDARRPVAAIDTAGKIVCVGLNYGDHAAEGGRAAPERPLLFSKFANAVVGDGDAIVRPEGTRALDLEVELGVVIGRRARRVRADEAMDHVAGYVVVNDVSARDWQGNKAALAEGEKGDGQWLRAKGSDTFLPMGPDFVTSDELEPADGLRLRSWRIPGPGAANAGQPQPMQDGSTADLIFPIPDLIAFISRAITLEPGDLI